MPTSIARARVAPRRKRANRSCSSGSTPRGRGAFARLTKVIARVGERDQAWHHLAVVVGDEIVAFPEVDFDVYPNGIVDAPHIRIATPTEADARRLARRVRGE